MKLIAVFAVFVLSACSGVFADSLEKKVPWNDKNLERLDLGSLGRDPNGTLQRVGDKECRLNIPGIQKLQWRVCPTDSRMMEALVADNKVVIRVIQKNYADYILTPSRAWDYWNVKILAAEPKPIVKLQWPIKRD